jgi:hypothetical protein
MGDSYAMVERAVNQFLALPVPSDQQDRKLADILTKTANDFKAQVQPILETCNKSERTVLEQLVAELCSTLVELNKGPKKRLQNFLAATTPAALQQRLQSIKPSTIEKFTALLKSIKANLIRVITLGFVKPEKPVVKFTRCVASVASELRAATTDADQLSLRP